MTSHDTGDFINWSHQNLQGRPPSSVAPWVRDENVEKLMTLDRFIWVTNGYVPHL